MSRTRYRRIGGQWVTRGNWSGLLPASGAPGAMRNLVATAPAAGQAQLAADLPETIGGSALTGLIWSRDDPTGTLGGPWTSPLQPVTSSPFLFQYLTAGTYTLSVRAVNAAGPGPVASATQVVTGTETAPTYTEGALTTPANATRRAAEFTHSVGVCTHLTYGGTPYTNRGALLNAIDYLGIKHLRDGWGTGRDELAAWVIANLRPRGVKLCMVGDNRDWAPNNIDTMVNGSTILAEWKRVGILPDIAIQEGPNEYDVTGRQAQAKATTLSISSAFRGDAAAAHVKIASTSWADTNDVNKYTAHGDIGSSIDYVNFHPYPGRDNMMNDTILGTMGRNGRYIKPTASGTPLPTIATEHGFSNGTGDAPSAAPMPIAQQVAQTLRVYLEDFRGIGSGAEAVHVVKSYKYELVDEYPNGLFESNFGLFFNDWTPKATATALRNLLLILADTGASAGTFTPTNLGHTLTTSGPTRSVMMQKADGTWWLAFWQQVKNYEGTTGAILNPSPVTLTLTVPTSRTVTSYSPHVSSSGTSLGSGTSFSVQSSFNPTVLRIA